MHDRDVTFICGRAGVCSLGAVAAKLAGDDESLRYYLAQFEKVIFSLLLKYVFELAFVKFDYE